MKSSGVTTQQPSSTSFAPCASFVTYFHGLRPFCSHSVCLETQVVSRYFCPAPLPPAPLGDPELLPGQPRGRPSRVPGPPRTCGFMISINVSWGQGSSCLKKKRSARRPRPSRRASPPHTRHAAVCHCFNSTGQLFSHFRSFQKYISLSCQSFGLVLSMSCWLSDAFRRIT